MVSAEEGKLLLNVAKSAVRAQLVNEPLSIDEDTKKKFSFKKQGLLITIKNSKGDVRGSMGYPEPIYNLLDTVIKAAKLSAFHDPRTLPVKKKELPELTFILSLMTDPEEILGKSEEKLREIRIGEHGVMVKFGPFKGTLFPADGKDLDWTPQRLLENACIKAGLAPEMWNDAQLKVYKFKTEVFEG